MRVLKASVANFASYKSLDFDFEKRGLTLVSGATGSGKSTLCDLVPWVLFGKTAKDGAADDVVSWNAKGPTTGEIEVEAGATRIRIVRTRKPNDLYYILTNEGLTKKRGKDLNDTQSQINTLLGLKFETYLASAYYHEFSQTASFFTANAKQRRALTEQLSDLSTPIKLQELLSEYKSEVKAELDGIESRIKSQRKSLDYVEKQLVSVEKLHKVWASSYQVDLETAKVRSKNFETEKQKAVAQAQERVDSFRMSQEAEVDALLLEIEAIGAQLKSAEHFKQKRDALAARKDKLGDETCAECGAKKNSAAHLLIVKDGYAIDNEENENSRLGQTLRVKLAELDRLNKAKNPFTEQVKKERERENTYEARYTELLSAKNPHDSTLALLSTQKRELQSQIADTQEELVAFKQEIADVGLLTDITKELRALLVKNTIMSLEKTTNALLTKHFDAEIQVKFDIEDADKLEVTITKDGNECSYSQLSKGQRCLLKLCFGISVMRSVAMHSSVSLNAIFLDEALDGLDETLKLRSYNLFQELQSEYESIFVVEHNEALKTMFNNRISVVLNNGWSEFGEA